VTVLDRLKDVVGAKPQCVAIDEHGVETTYAELWRRSGQVASQVRLATVDGRSLSTNTLVGLGLGKSADYVAALVGIWRASMVVLPLPPELPRARRATIAVDAGCGWTLTEIVESGAPIETDWARSSHDLAYVIYTSGSTGRPKGVAVEQGSLLAIIEGQIAAFDIRPSDRCAWELSPAFDASLSDVFTTLLTGATLVINSGGSVLDRLHRGRISVADLPPAVLPHLDVDGLPPSLRTIIFGGEPADIDAVCRLARRVEMINVYGPTETTICASSCRCDPGWSRALIGAPLPGVEFRVVDDELWIGGVGVAREYWKNPTLTARKFVSENAERWFRSGDRVRPIDGGLEFLGRVDRQLKVRGKLVAPEEVESVLLNHPDVVRAAVFGVTRAGLVQLVGAIQLSMDGARSGWVEKRAQIMTHLRTYLPDWMIPSHLECAQSMPATSSGKVDYARLSKGRALLSPQAAILARRWTELLGKAPRDDSGFVECGGDSLQAVAMLAAADAEGVCLSPGAFDESPRFADLVRAAERGGRQSGIPVSELRARARRIADALPDIGPSNDGEAKTILLTGATGFLGRQLLTNLLARTDARLIALVRGSSDQDARARIPVVSDRLTVLRADLARPRCGLGEHDWEQLAHSVDTVVHGAARVHVALPYERLVPANVFGTAEIVKFLATGRPKRLVYTSTLSVVVSSDRSNPWVEERDEFDDRDRIFGGYAQSKWVAERLILDTVPTATIVRLGLLTAGADTPPARDEWFGHFVRGVVAVGAVPVVLESALQVDLTPVDFAAEAMAEFVLKPGLSGIVNLANPRSAGLDEVLASIVRVTGLPTTSLTHWRRQAIARLRDTAQPSIGAAMLALRRTFDATGHWRGFDLFAATGVRFELARGRSALPDSLVCPAPDAPLIDGLVRRALEVE
jgi:thioester reductase-like protein